jgi:hypothetical protein
LFQARESWKGKINKLLTSQYVPKCRPIAQAGLELVRTVLLGEKDALKRCTGHWAELLIAHLFHRRPNMKVGTLRSEVKESVYSGQAC